MSFPFLQPYAGLSNSLQTAQAAGGPGGAVGGWVELGRTTLGSSQDEIDVTSLPDKRYYMVLMDLHGASGSPEVRMDFNNDTGTNYATRGAIDGGADFTDVSKTSMELNGANNNDDRFTFSYIANLASKEKLMISQHMANNGAGAANAPDLRTETVNKWVNTSNSISSIRPFFLSGRTYGSGSECVVLGWSPDDTHTSNFWEELASVDLSGGAADSIGSGTFTSKKYLWVQCFTNATGGNNDHKFTVNSDTGSNYSKRTSTSGVADGTNASQANLDLTGTHNVSNFTNMFIINNASNEKLFIIHDITVNTAGAGTAPERTETVGKWANTSNQINEVTFTNAVARTGQYGTNSILKVWGSD